MQGTALSSPATSGQAAARRSAFADIHRFRTWVLEGERAGLFRALHQPRPAVALGQAAEAWGLIFASWALCAHVSPLLLPLALVVVGSRQRALGNALHDAAHGNMLSGRHANQRLATWLLALPMGEDFELYRTEHLRHHAYLGDPHKDPDYLEPPREPGGQPVRSPWRFYRHFLLKGSLWRKSLLGDLPRMRPAQRLRVLAWWAVVLGGLAAAAGPLAALAFAALWALARATVYHAIKVFAEVSDHVGLRPGSIAGYTRNLPGNWLSFFLHPHHDNYHLTHHLFPRIPLANLRRLHELLLAEPGYASGHHCHSYFRGPSSVVRSWIQPP